MAAFEVRSRVFARNRFGEFISELEAAATKTAEDGAIEMAAYAKGFAPTRTGAMRDTIQPVMLSAREGAAVVGTDHWRHQEDGTLPHPISGNLGFFWDKAGRWFGRPWPATVQHPGNPAVHFMHRAYEIVKTRMMAHARRNFPG